MGKFFENLANGNWQMAIGKAMSTHHRRGITLGMIRVTALDS